jgi:phosphoserine phosphatase
MSFPSDAAEASPIPRVTSDDVIARLDALLATLGHAPSEAMLAFDADGTLWSGDVGVDNFESLLDRGGVLPAAGPALRAEAAAAGLPLTDDPTAQARTLYEAYLAGVYHEDRAFRMMAWVFAGYREADVQGFAAEVATRSSLRARLHAEVLTVIAWGVRRGMPRYVVSASHAVVVASSIEQLGLAIDGVFAMRQALEGDVFAARIEEPATYGAGKTAALEAGAAGKVLLGAFGDSAFDLHLLAEARLPVAVRPKPELRRRARECAGLVELGLPAS